MSHGEHDYDRRSCRRRAKAICSEPGSEPDPSTRLELVQLAGKIDWAWIDGEIAPLYMTRGGPVSKPLRDRLAAAQAYVQAIRRRRVRALESTIRTSTSPARRSSSTPSRTSISGLSHWRARARLGDKLDLLLAESLQVAHDGGALRTGTWRGSPSTPRCSPRTSPSRPTPSSCRRRSRASIAWPAATQRAVGRAHPTSASPGRRR